MKHFIDLKYPAAWWGAKWRDALPAGNGTIGAGVYGAVHDETVLLTHEDLWHGVRTPEMPDISNLLPKLRTLLNERKLVQADRLYAKTLKHLGYNPRMGYPLPLGDLRIHMPVGHGFREYRRRLDMQTGVVSVFWKDGDAEILRKLFVSRVDNLVVMEISSSADLPETAITLEVHDPDDNRSHTDKREKLPTHITTVTEGEWVSYAGHNDDGTDFGAVARVVVLPGQENGAPAGSLEDYDGSIHVSGARRILVLVKVFCRGSRHTAWETLRAELEDITPDYDLLLAPHVREHSDLFERVDLDLGGDPADHSLSNEELLLDAYQGHASRAMIEKLWAYGRYLLICSSRPGGQPCPLHGKWSGSYRGMWAFHMVNENLQMIYWQALGGMLSETVLPVFDYFERLMDDFRENARKLYGCRGIYIPAPSTPDSGLLKTISPHIIYWTGGAAWVGQIFYDYYLHTGDVAFLRDRAVPFLREVSLFYEDFFTVDEEGYLVSAPSNSPENTPGNYWDGRGMGSAQETTMNATLDFALAKEVWTQLIEASDVVEIDADDVERWKLFKAKIPPYQVNSDGAIREWMHPYFDDNYHHRHQSHIYPVFPGREVTRHSDPDLFHAFETAIRQRLVIGISEQTGWSLAHMACVYARMSEGDRALECLDLLARSSIMNNFFTTHNDWRQMGIGVDMTWAPFQIDANMGWTAAVQEMLLFSLPGEIIVLPALPPQWPKGSIRGLAARGGIRISISWDIPAGRIDVALCSLGRSQAIDLILPSEWISQQGVSLEADQELFLQCERMTAEAKVPGQTQ